MKAPPFLGEGTPTSKGKDEGHPAVGRKAGKHPRTRNENQLTSHFPLLFPLPSFLFLLSSPSSLTSYSPSLSHTLFLVCSVLVISPSPPHVHALERLHSIRSPFASALFLFLFYLLSFLFCSDQASPKLSYPAKTKQDKRSTVTQNKNRNDRRLILYPPPLPTSN